ncbi:glycoside hydrolase superfamily [Podospora didyma]|uniref:alpha-galactosidase n=1 Tax=Podospora didyma TaxID=330526 RepID=A0AAE0U456_9PEZI|nr:glycoside hydrolase superfamily [Podospora didyma]
MAATKKAINLLLLAAMQALVSAVMAAPSTKTPPGFVPGVKWQIEIQNPLSAKSALAPTDALVWDIDLYHVERNPAIIQHIRSAVKDATIICYFNAGLAQTSDCDFNSVWQTPAHKKLLANPIKGFEGEFWIDIKSQDARDLIKHRIALAQKLGCDGVDPDNIDGYGIDEGGDNGTGWNLSQTDYIKFITELATYAHSLTSKRGFPILIGQKNAPEIAPKVAPVLDFAVLEGCKGLQDGGSGGSGGFCDVFAKSYLDAGKPVFSIGYPKSLGGRGGCKASGVDSAEFAKVCAKSADMFSDVLKLSGGDVELDGCTQYCGLGVGKGVVTTAVDKKENETGECPRLGSSGVGVGEDLDSGEDGADKEED